MKYEDILTFPERLKANRPTSEADINARLLEEIAELRHYIEFRLPKPAPTNWGKVRTITADGRCMGWDGHEVNNAP